MIINREKDEKSGEQDGKMMMRRKGMNGKKKREEESSPISQITNLPQGA